MGEPEPAAREDDFLAGIGRASPEVQGLIRRRARWKAARTPPPVVVEPADFLSRDEVKQVVGRRANPGTDYRRLAATGLLGDAYRSTDGESGFTRSSVERELRWRSQATWLARFRREARILAGPLVGWWRYPPDT